MEAHKVLGVPENASEEQVRAAYKALALKWHPDRQLQNSEEATSKFVEINKANKTMLRALARARRAAKATQGYPTSNPPPPSSPSTSPSPSLKRPTRSTRFRRSPSPSQTSSRSPSSSPAHSPQLSRSSSSSQSHEDTPCTSSSSVTSAPVSPSNTSINSKGPAPAPEKHRDSLHKKPSHQTNNCDPNPKTFLHPDDSPACDPDFVGDTLRPERSILRGAGADTPKKWVHVLNMTLEEIYQGKTFHFRLIRYNLSGKKSIVPLNVTVPLGSRDGTEVIVTNVGNERKDGTRQDIVFLVKTLRHKHFTRVHDDLLLEVRLPWVDILDEKEGEVRLNGIDGKEYVFHVNFCNTGLLTGSTIIPNAGMPCRGGEGRGRIVIRWEISSPLSSWDTIKHVLKFKA